MNRAGEDHRYSGLIIKEQLYIACVLRAGHGGYCLVVFSDEVPAAVGTDNK